MKTTAAVLLIAALMAAPVSASAAAPPPTKPVPTGFFSGRWYEIARLPTKSQKDCEGSISQFTGANASGDFNVTQTCRVGSLDGPLKSLAVVGKIMPGADNAKFAVTFLKLGLIPGDGGAWLLPRVVGMSRASEMLFSGMMIDAAKAKDWGLVSEVVPADKLMEAAMELAQRIAQQPSHALRLAKTLLRQGQTTSYDTILEMSAAAQAISHMTEDHMEGVNALLEKRAPRFTG